MYAVIHDRGREHRVAEGDTVEVDLKAEVAVGDEVVFADVRLLKKGDEVLVGTPSVEGAEVRGTVLGMLKAEKIVSYKFKRRQGYHRKQGHRQRYTRVRITGITG